MYGRVLDLAELLEHRSVFLFGPRQTGKSTLVRATLPDAACYDLLEHLVFLELRGFLDYRRRDEPLCYWRSRSQFEVDFVVGDAVAIEVKAKPRVATRDYRGLLALAEEVPLRRKLVVCDEKRRRLADDGVEILPVPLFLRELWEGRILG